MVNDGALHDDLLAIYDDDEDKVGLVQLFASATRPEMQEARKYVDNFKRFA